MGQAKERAEEIADLKEYSKVGNNKNNPSKNRIVIGTHEKDNKSKLVPRSRAIHATKIKLSNITLSEYIDMLLENLIIDIDEHWQSEVKDNDLAVVFRRTLVRTEAVIKQMNKNEQLSMLNRAKKISDEEIYGRQILICQKLGIEFLNNNQDYSQSTNNIHSKAPHTVNGHWRNQPYGNRNNPQYKKIWINDFEKCA